MKTVRFALSAVALLLLCGGYLASQAAYFDQSAPHGVRAYEYALRVDQPPVVYSSLLLFLIAVILAFVPDDKETDKQS